MPGKTNTEAIRDLEQAVAKLLGRMDATGEELGRLRDNHAKTVEGQAQLDKRLTVLEERFADLKKALEESDRRRWALWLAFFGSLLTLLVNVALLLIGRK